MNRFDISLTNYARKENFSSSEILVIQRLYYYGTIGWKNHEPYSFFHKSIRDMAQELHMSTSSTRSAYQSVVKAIENKILPFFEVKIEIDKNFPIYKFRVDEKQLEMFENHCSENHYSKRSTVAKITTVPYQKSLQYCSENRYGINIITHINNSMSIRDARETPKVDDQQKVEVPNRQTDDSSKMVEIWNSIIRPCKPETMTDRRELQCLEVLRDHFNNDLDNWRQHCIRITQSSYLMGDKFTLHLSWALKPEWIQVVRSGRYDDEAWRLEKKAKEESSRQSLTQRPVITIDEALSDCTSEVDRKVKEVLFRSLGAVTYDAWIKGRAFEMKGDQICITSCGDYTRKRIGQDFGDQLKQAYAAVYASLSDCKSSLIDHREGVDIDLLIYGNKPLTLSGDVLWAK